MNDHLHKLSSVTYIRNKQVTEDIKLKSFLQFSFLFIYFLDLNFSVSPPYGLAFIQNPNLQVLLITPKFLYLPSREEHTMPKGWHAPPSPPPPLIFPEGKWILLVYLGGGIQPIKKRGRTLWYRCGSFLKLGMIPFWATFL